MMINFTEHLDPAIRHPYGAQAEAQNQLDTMQDDVNFSHVFKRVQSEYLMTSEDGDFVDM